MGMTLGSAAWKEEENSIRKRWKFRKNHPWLVTALRWKWETIFIAIVGYCMIFILLALLYCYLNFFAHILEGNPVWISTIVGIHALLFTGCVILFWLVSLQRTSNMIRGEFLTKMLNIVSNHDETAGDLRMTFMTGVPLDMSNSQTRQKFLAYIETLGKVWVLAEQGNVRGETLKQFFEGSLMDLFRSKEIVTTFFDDEEDLKRLWSPGRSNFLRMVLVIAEYGSGQGGIWDYFAQPFLQGQSIIKVTCHVARLMSSVPPTVRLKDRYFTSFLLQLKNTEESVEITFDTTSHTVYEFRDYLLSHESPQLANLGADSVMYLRKNGTKVKTKEEKNVFLWELMNYGSFSQSMLAVIKYVKLDRNSSGSSTSSSKGWKLISSSLMKHRRANSATETPVKAVTLESLSLECGDGDFGDLKHHKKQLSEASSCT